MSEQNHGSHAADLGADEATVAAPTPTGRADAKRSRDKGKNTPVTPVPLVFENVGIAFRSGRKASSGREVVHGVDFDIQPGEILALVGESGSGKTVTALSAVKVLPDNSDVAGAIRLGDTDLLTLPDAQMRKVRGNRIAVIFQDPVNALNPVFTIGFQLVEAIKHRRPDMSKAAARERAVELLRTVGIPDPEARIKYYPHQFSGGQCQRIMIAMALSCEPDILIADEPTTALDVTVQQGILDVLVDLRNRLGMSVLIITHDMGVVADVADRVVVMRDGKVEERASARDLFAAPQSDYAKKLLAAVPRMATEPRESTARQADVPTLDIDDLVVTYQSGRRKVHAVKGISMHVMPGEVLGVVGESGSGKSTVGKTVLGAAPVTEGAVRVGGVDLASVRGAKERAVRRQIGTIFQNPTAALNPRFTIGDAIVEPARVHEPSMSSADRRKRTSQLLDAVQLPTDWINRYPHELSGGQRQRVCIARALFLRPSLLIADEPTSALDVSVQASVLTLLRELQNEMEFACLFISHDLAVVSQLCDRVAVMQAGRVVEEGPYTQVLQHPEHEYTRQLLASAPLPDPELQARRRIERLAKSA